MPSRSSAALGAGAGGLVLGCCLVVIVLNLLIVYALALIATATYDAVRQPTWVTISFWPMLGIVFLVRAVFAMLRRSTT